MSYSLRALLVEDSEDDALLVVRELERNWNEVSFLRVDDRDSFVEALSKSAWDVVLSDFAVPSFEAPEVLELLAAGGSDVPCIIVSGAVGEQVAVDCMRAGAKDYILKHNLTRLNAAVEREVLGASARRRAKKTQQRLHAVLEQTSDFVFISDLRGQGLYLNRAGRGMIGIGEEVDITTVGIADYTPDRALRLMREEGFPTAIREGSWTGTGAIRSPRGREIPVSHVILSHTDEEGNVEFLSTIARDLTQERQLHQAQKMESIGRLTGGVAHDFNNLLTIISSYVGFLKERFEADDSAREDVAVISDAVKRGALLTAQLLAFSRQSVMEEETLVLKTLISDLDGFLQRIIGEDIELSILYAREPWQIEADRSRIEQILMNLVVNARDAMLTGGHLRIATANVVIGEEDAHHYPETPPGEYVVLTVSDTGVGMDEATRVRAFEPFFTTKGGGAGTGLGLATVYGIVKQSGGDVRIESEPGSGTTVKVYLPRVAKPDASQQEERYTGGAAPGTETILLAEDEAAVREGARRILESQGYAVLEACDGMEALLCAERHDGPIHLLLSDVVMPHMSGPELALKLLESRPQTRTLFMSGYTDEAMSRHGLSQRSAAMLPKPFSRDALLSKVRAVLARPPERHAGTRR